MQPAGEATVAESTREKLRQLIDQLPDSELHAAERYLVFLVAEADPLLRMLLDAPIDDEPETEEERAAVAEALAELERGEVVTDQELRRELGI